MLRYASIQDKEYSYMKISTFLKPLSFLPALALMYMIYSFSAQTGKDSSMLSYRASEAIVRTVNTVTVQNWDDWQVQAYANQLNGIVRKGAHVTEYFLLAIAVSFPLYVYGVRGILLMLLAGAICVGYAFGDEYHQSLVAGRAASTRDVAIDSIGIFFGIILTRLIGWSGRMAITGPAYERQQNRRQKELDEREEELIRREQALQRRESRQADRRQAERRQPERRQAERRQAEAPLRRPRSAGYDAPDRSGAMKESGNVYASGSSGSGGVDDRTRVYGPASDVDDRTKVFRTARQQEEYEENYRRASYERRKVQSPDLQDDNTSDQLSEDIPFSGLFRKRD